MRKVTLSELLQLSEAVRGQISKIYLHWTAGHRNQFFEHYHINVAGDGSIYVSTEDLTEHKDHTYKRNTGAIGVAVLGAYKATPEDLGPEPPTAEQIEAVAQLIAVLCASQGLPVTDQYVMTHAEAANNVDGEDPGYEANGYPEGRYGPGYSCERWDLWILETGGEPWSGGNTLRGKAIWYQQNWNKL